MRKPSLVQLRFSAPPQSGFTVSLSCVICFQLPIGPAHTSCGCRKESRTAAVVTPSRAIDSEIARPVETCSAPLHTCSTPPLADTRANPDMPLMSTPARIVRESPSHVSVAALACMPGVRFVAAPPLDGTIMTSPPFDPWSLISPSMKAMLLPSGDQRGQATCSAGL